MLLVKDLHAYYGRAHILHGVSLEASAGEVVALLGRNGAGKSTAMKTIMGLVPAAKGEVTLRRPAHRAPAALSHRPAGPGLRAGGPAHLHRAQRDGEPRRRPAAAARSGAPSWTEDKLFALFPNLATHARAAGRAHVGRRAADAHHRPHPDGQPALRAARRAVGRAGADHRRADGALDPCAQGRGAVACCCASRTCTSAQAVADRAYIIEKGQIRFGGTMAELDGRRFPP